MHIAQGLSGSIKNEEKSAPLLCLCLNCILGRSRLVSKKQQALSAQQQQRIVVNGKHAHSIKIWWKRQMHQQQGHQQQQNWDEQEHYCV